MVRDVRLVWRRDLTLVCCIIPKGHHMRRFLLLTAFIPAHAFADQIDATSRITAVTIFPSGAQVTRVVEFTAPAGTHDLLITDLPAQTYAEALRIAPGQGVQLGSYAVRDTGLPSKAVTEAEAAGKAEVVRLEGALRAADAGMAEVQTRIDAAMARAAFLQAMKVEPLVDAASVATLRDMARMVGEEVLAAGTDALMARGELAEAAAARVVLEEELARVVAAMEGRMAEGSATSVGLEVQVVTAEDGGGRVVVTQFVEGASWQPVYDLRLTQGDAPTLVVDRGVLVQQETGEDWAGVALTLSTADLNAQSVPSELYPEYRRIDAEVDQTTLRMQAAADSTVVEFAEEPAPVTAAVPTYEGIAEMQGETVVYTYAAPANIASGVTDLRLSLDAVTLTPDLTARAVPRADATAFLMADVVNTGTEVLLPGQATLYRDGAMIGMTQLPAVQPGENAEVAFGAIDGLRLARDMPTRAEGDTGIITTSRQIDEVAVLEVENLTDRAWDVRLMDLVPYSEQVDLEITYVAEPAVTEADVDGKRGVLAWDFAIAAGEVKTVTLSHRINWPEGQVLQ
jgi:uncharacterized protein (TIGR02231 family)